MRLAITVVVTTLLMGLTARGAAPQDAPADRTGWDREGAARYLDERMDAWFANAKKLQTGQRKTACVSCHLTVPYVLSRSVLRQAMHVGSATPQEVRLLEEATWRVETYDAHEPLYASNERKKAESRGTEAVLNALILARADAEQKRQDASEPTRKALRRLWETQRSDGAWDWLDAGLEPFESVDAAYYGAALAALAIGTAPALAGLTVGLQGRRQNPKALGGRSRQRRVLPGRHQGHRRRLRARPGVHQGGHRPLDRHGQDELGGRRSR